MSWLSEWKALSAQIEGLLEAARFYIESSGSGEKDVYMVANRQLLPQIKFIVLVSSDFLTIPADEIEEAITYRHINIAVDPSTPSRTSNRSWKVSAEQ